MGFHSCGSLPANGGHGHSYDRECDAVARDRLRHDQPTRSSSTGPETLSSNKVPLISPRAPGFFAMIFLNTVV